MNGYEYEEKCGEYLLKKGFTNVEVTPKSGDFGIDIIACKDGTKYGIQCKYYDKPVGNKAVQEAYAGSTYYKCDKPMVITNTTFTNQAKVLAESLGVELWEDVNAIVLMEALTLSPEEKIQKKITDTKAYYDDSYNDMQLFLNNNAIDESNCFFTATIIGNRCHNQIQEINTRLENLKNDPPCPKSSVLYLVELMEKMYKLMLSLGKYGFKCIYEDGSLVTKWKRFSESISYLDEESSEKEEIEKSQKEKQEQLEKERKIEENKKLLAKERDAKEAELKRAIEQESLRIKKRNKRILFAVLLSITGIWIIFKILIPSVINNNKMSEFQEAIASQNWNKAEEISDYFYEHNHDKRIKTSVTLEKARKDSMSQKERLKYYPDDYINVFVPYKTHYQSGVVDYGIEVSNNSSFDITITSLTIKNKEIENEEKISVNIDVNAYSDISTVITIGEGNRKKGGSTTTAGSVDGSNAYFCTSFSIQIKD